VKRSRLAGGTGSWYESGPWETAFMLPFGPQHAVVGGHGTPAALYALAALLVGILAARHLIGWAPGTRP